MGALRKPETHFTEKEYFAFEQDTAMKHEYFRGQIYAMAGASPRHNRITLATASSIYSQLRGRPCDAFSSDQRLKIESSGLITYPDVLVACPPLRYDEENSYTLLDATVIVEVLSPSTAAYDRGAKFEFYKELPSLRHYVLVEQDRIYVEHHWLDAETGEWRPDEFSSLLNEIRLETIDCVLSVSELYERVEF